MDFVVVDVETCPIDEEAYLSLEEEDRKKLLNPIDSRIVAIGLKHGKEPIILFHSSEKRMLEDFWAEIAAFRKGNPAKKIVGFNIKNFDLPFLVTRSFIHEVKIMPFLLKEVIDLREKLSAYKFGHVRGTLKEYGSFLGFEELEMDGSQVCDAYWSGEHEKLKEYLKNDLLITEKVCQRLIETSIMDIDRW